MKKNTIKLNEEQLKEVITESVRRVLKETFQYVINDFQQKMIQKANEEDIAYDMNAIMELANRVYKESFSNYDYYELIDDWKMCGGPKAIAYRIKLKQQGKEYKQPSLSGDWGQPSRTLYLPSNRTY